MKHLDHFVSTLLFFSTLAAAGCTVGSDEHPYDGRYNVTFIVPGQSLSLADTEIVRSTIDGVILADSGTVFEVRGAVDYRGCGPKKGNSSGIKE